MGVSSSKTSDHVLETPRGNLRGIQLTSEDGKPIYQRYTKIPYAQPPIGFLRWRRPQPLSSNFSFSDSSGQPGNYTKFGAVCPQPVYDHKEARLDNPDAAPEEENIQDEDCLFLNIWVPAGTPPKGGWPVCFFLHGGWLQVGDAMQDHLHDPEDLFVTTDVPRIVISPTYRLNMLGFPAGQPLADVHEDEAPGNYGFWDQRMALEWTASNIELFGGNPGNITMGGLSAGANSTFFQLYYDTYLPAEKRLIKRIFLWSNAVGIQPNSVTSDAATTQFDELCTAVGVDTSLDSKQKVEGLRQVSSSTLISTIKKLKLHTFRATTDNSFISSDFLNSLHDGTFTTRLADNGVSVMLGEVADEWKLYRLVNPPSDLAGLDLQLRNYYPGPVVDALLKHYDLPQGDGQEERWKDTYAKIVADCQVHAMIRGLAFNLWSGPNSPALKVLGVHGVHRYRIRWRARSLDSWIDPECGVCHGADAPIWWCSGFRAGYTDEDKQHVLEFLKPFGKFIAGEQEIGWDAKGLMLQEMGEDGVTRTVKDEDWERAIAVWDCMRDAQGITKS